MSELQVIKRLNITIRVRVEQHPPNLQEVLEVIGERSRSLAVAIRSWHLAMVVREFDRKKRLLAPLYGLGLCYYVLAPSLGESYLIGAIFGGPAMMLASVSWMRLSWEERKKLIEDLSNDLGGAS